jgi:putative flippase GtrA
MRRCASLLGARAARAATLMTPPIPRLAVRLLRSAGAGAAATLVDLAFLTGLVSLAGVSPRAASVPALVLGNVVTFFGQKYFAFRAQRAHVTGQAASFVLVEGGGFVLNVLLFELVLRLLPAATLHYALTRLLTTNAVWLLYSFPLWHLVFRPKNAAKPVASLRKSTPL